jgi:hypothetical protein
MPWLPELFTAPALARIWEDERRRQLALVPFFAGVMSGERRALLESFAGDPEVHDPIRGRVKGAPAFERFVSELSDWLAEHRAVAEDVEFILTPGRGVEELILHLDTDDGPIALPVAVASDHDERGRIVEQRIYFSTRPLLGRHANRPPVLQPHPGLDLAGIVGEYHGALAAGDANASVAALERDAVVRDPAGHAHRGADEVRELHQRLLTNGGLRLERCAVTDDGRACALEYNVVARGTTTLRPQAGVAVHVRGDSGRLAAVRSYDDAEAAVGGVASALTRLE